MRMHADSFSVDAALFIEGTEKWLDWVLTVQSPVDNPQLSQAGATMESLGKTAAGALTTMERFRDQVESVRNVNEQMDIACGSLVDAANICINSTRSIVTMCEQRSRLLIA
jgi:uncharacterized protein YyaL (SSP411 family)